MFRRHKSNDKRFKNYTWRRRRHIPSYTIEGQMEKQLEVNTGNDALCMLNILRNGNWNSMDVLFLKVDRRVISTSFLQIHTNFLL